MRIDIRAGSKELILPLKTLGVPVESAMLPAGDVEIIGNGPEGPTVVGVEYKKVPDLLQCVRNGRFAEQLRGMKDSYQISWLLIEGRVKGYSYGESMEIRRGTRWFKQPGHVTYAEVASYVITMALKGGCLVWRTENQEETVAWLKSLYRWFTSKEWEDHRAHLGWYEPPVSGNPFTGPTLTQRVAATLPGIGAGKSEKVAAHFKSVHDMINAPVEEWVKIDGVGKKGASRIVELIQQGNVGVQERG